MCIECTTTDKIKLNSMKLKNHWEAHKYQKHGDINEFDSFFTSKIIIVLTQYMSYNLELPEYTYVKCKKNKQLSEEEEEEKAMK